MKSAIKFLINKPFIIAIILLIIQQLIVASSTYWIAKMATQISNHQNFTLYLIFFIISLIIVYIPGCTALIFLEKSKFLALRKYIEEFCINFNNKISIHQDKKSKDYHLPYISSEGFLVFNESASFIFEFLAVILNVTFNVITLALVLDKSIITSYLIGLFLVIIFIFLFKSKVHFKATQAQQGRTSLQRILSLSWDNILIGNKYNQNIYQKELQSKQNFALKTAINNQVSSKIVSTFGMLVLMTPVITCTLYIIFKNMENYTILSVLVATLPRQILILQFAYSIVDSLTNYSSISAKLKGLYDAIKPNTNILKNINQRIKWNKLQFKDKNNLFKITNLDEFINKNIKSHGRITITGDNGSGKSTFLGILKEKFGYSAYYLPTNHELIFKINKNLSTGQKIKEFIQEISNNIKDIKIIILDEWDANLSLQSKNQINKIIDELSKSLLIIEVRHHI